MHQQLLHGQDPIASDDSKSCSQLLTYLVGWSAQQAQDSSSESKSTSSFWLFGASDSESPSYTAKPEQTGHDAPSQMPDAELNCVKDVVTSNLDQTKQAPQVTAPQSNFVFDDTTGLSEILDSSKLDLNALKLSASNLELTDSSHSHATCALKHELKEQPALGCEEAALQQSKLQAKAQNKSQEVQAKAVLDKNLTENITLDSSMDTLLFTWMQIKGAATTSTSSTQQKLKAPYTPTMPSAVGYASCTEGLPVFSIADFPACPAAFVSNHGEIGESLSSAVLPPHYSYHSSYCLDSDQTGAALGSSPELTTLANFNKVKDDAQDQQQHIRIGVIHEFSNLLKATKNKLSSVFKGQSPDIKLSKASPANELDCKETAKATKAAAKDTADQETRTAQANHVSSNAQKTMAGSSSCAGGSENSESKAHASLIGKRTLQDLKTLTGASRHNLMLQNLHRRKLQIVSSLGGLALAILALGGLIYQMSINTSIPYVVTVDTHGVVLSNGTAKPLMTLPKEVVTAQLCDFIRNVRMFSKDPSIQRQSIIKVYSFIRPGSNVAQQMTTYYKENNPFEIKDYRLVNIDIANAIETSEHTYQIDWTEETPDKGKIRKMRAQISFSVAPAQHDSTNLLLNPLGIFVESLVISKIMGS